MLGLVSSYLVILSMLIIPVSITIKFKVNRRLTIGSSVNLRFQAPGFPLSTISKDTFTNPGSPNFCTARSSQCSSINSTNKCSSHDIRCCNVCQCNKQLSFFSLKVGCLSFNDLQNGEGNRNFTSKLFLFLCLYFTYQLCDSIFKP